MNFKKRTPAILWTVLVFLPKEWNLESEKQEDKWPVEQLRSIGRLALRTDSWLAYRHTILANSDSSPLSEHTGTPDSY